MNQEQEPKYRVRCGLMFDFTGATWPFGSFALFSDCIEVNLLFEHYKILFKEISSVSKSGFLPFAFPIFGKGVRIKTSGTSMPKHIAIYSNQYKKIYDLIIQQMNRPSFH